MLYFQMCKKRTVPKAPMSSKTVLHSPPKEERAPPGARTLDTLIKRNTRGTNLFKNYQVS